MSDVIKDLSLPVAEMLAPLIEAKIGQPVNPAGLVLGPCSTFQGVRNTQVNCEFRDGTGRAPYRLLYDRYDLDRLFPSAIRTVSVPKVEIQAILYRLQLLYKVRYTADDFVIHSDVEQNGVHVVTLRPREGSYKFFGEVSFNCVVFIAS